MKALILGDTHFGGGYSLGMINSYRQLNSRLIDYSNTFDSVIDYMKEDGIKHLIITGDIYEHRRPQASELSIFAEKLYRLIEIGAYVHIVAGNHDIVRDQNSTTLDMLKNLKIPNICIYTDVNTAVCSDGGEDVINFIFFPFRTRQMLRCNTNQEAVNRLSSLLDYELSRITNGCSVLIGHYMLQDTVLGNTVASAPHNEVSLPIDMFSKLNGVIMGHVHSFSLIRDENPFACYIGSMERNNFGDADVPKRFIVVETEGNDLIYNIKDLNVRPIYNIEIDISSMKEIDPIDYCVEYLENYFSKNNPRNSIVRLTIFINETLSHKLKKDKIKKILKERIYYCVGFHVQVVSNRQLRKASITERRSPLEAFEEYLFLIEDEVMREMMRVRGEQIIRGKE